ncbi:hypothetical protein [Roseomonas elaeocarpi]|uniref:Phage tail protein n=1 Tax=Roseomonas elaeocarpi TaxID=907779 RepID=A0ABV6JQC0_9PROT
MLVPTYLSGTDGALLGTPQGGLYNVQRIDRLPVADEPTEDAVLIGVDGVEGARGGVVISFGAIKAQGAAAAAEAAQAVIGGTVDRVTALEAAVAALSYVAPDITGFSASPSVVEKGASVASVVLTVARNRTDLPVAITGASTATIPAGQTSVTVNGPFTAAASWTATITDGKATDTATASLAFQDKAYWGTSAKATLTSADILALGNSAFATGLGSRSVTYDATGGKYPFYAYPASFGTPAAVTVGGLGFSDFSVTDQAFTNASGATSTYRVLRFNTIQNGSAIKVVWA